MQYAFILGRVYTLSLAELFAVLPVLHPHEIRILEAAPEVLIIDTPVQMDFEKVQKHLGGTVKILKVIDQVAKKPTDYINFALQHYFKPSKLKNDFLKDYKGKVQFGLSLYTLDASMKTFGEVNRLGMAIKRAMQDSGASIRLVLPEENATSLASVVVTKNLLLQKGAEICILAGPDKVYTARTLIVQDFEDYGRRDYQRPVRDDKQGMIPPKVAQIMLNLSGGKYNDALLDPFCGVGTMLQEGVLLGFKMLGSDLNPVAVSGSEKNLEWFRNRYKVAKGKYHVEVSDARKVNELVQTMITINAIKGVQGIVTEGYLGPVYGKYPKREEIEKNFQELASLYDESTQEFLKFLPEGARIVMCLPAYKKNSQEYEKLPNLDFITKNGYNTIDLIDPQVAAALPFLRLTDRKTAIYDRKDQIVAREIVLFEKTVSTAPVATGDATTAE